jgi:peptidyl-tRNA hydrolase
MGKELSEEQKQALRERLAKGRATAAAKRAEAAVQAVQQAVNTNNPLPAGQEPKHGTTTVSGDQDLGALMKQAIEAIQMLATLQAAGATQTGTGMKLAPDGKRLTGTYEKFSLDPSRYQDPCERLSNEPRLQRFAFKDNYELKYYIGANEYDTIDHVHIREPKFTLELIRKIYSEETGELTNGRYIVCRMVLNEDPPSALMIAHQMGLDPESMSEAAFLDEMRYIKMRDWLVDCFYPPKVGPATKRKEMVIGNKLVEYYEVNSSTNDKVPFNQIDPAKML